MGGALGGKQTASVCVCVALNFFVHCLAPLHALGSLPEHVLSMSCLVATMNIPSLVPILCACMIGKYAAWLNPNCLGLAGFSTDVIKACASTWPFQGPVWFCHADPSLVSQNTAQSMQCMMNEGSALC